MKTTGILLLMFLLLAASLSAQVTIRDPPVPHVTKTFYYPCYSTWTAASSGPIGCASYANCSPVATTGSAQIGVSWYNWWACNDGFVISNVYTSEVDGVWIDPTFGGSWIYWLGLDADGWAEVHNEQYEFDLVITYHGFEYMDCNGVVNYTNGYNFYC